MQYAVQEKSMRKKLRVLFYLYFYLKEEAINKEAGIRSQIQLISPVKRRVTRSIIHYHNSLASQ
jgi:hypothetical protein